MNFQDEMKKVFLQVAAGVIEPAEWEQWWNRNKDKLEAVLTRGDQMRIMPAMWSTISRIATSRPYRPVVSATA